MVWFVHQLQALAKIEKVSGIPPSDAPFLLYSFVEEGCRFLPIFVSFGQNSKGKHFEVMYQSLTNSPTWSVTYFENLFISAVKRVETSRSEPDRGDDTLRIRNSVTELYFDRQTASQALAKLPISKLIRNE
jgi:hypothetical protein